MISESRRHQIIWEALAGRKSAAVENRNKLKVRDQLKLSKMVEANRTMQSRHETRLKNFYKLKDQPRICTMNELMEMLTRHNPMTGMQHSYAEKCLICRQQIQLRKKLDRLTSVGDIRLQNHTQAGIEDPLSLLIADLALVFQHEILHGIPRPKPPVRAF